MEGTHVDGLIGFDMIKKIHFEMDGPNEMLKILD